MITDTEQEIMRAKIRRWRNVRSGWMVIRPHQIVILRIKFLGSPEEVASFESNQLTSVGQDPVNKDLRLTFSDPQGEVTQENISLAGGTQFITVTTALDVLLKGLEEHRRQRKEETARLEKEQQERLEHLREAFACEIWETCEVLWLLARAGYSMVQAIIMADSDETRQQYSIVWQQADRLKNIHNLDLTSVLTELDEMVKSRNSKEVIRKASILIKQLSDQILQTEKIWSKWQEHREMLSAVLPNCDHLPYFWLFSAGHFESLLAARIEDWAGVNEAFPLLQSSGTILRNCYAIDLNGHLEASNFAAGERNLGLYIDTCRRVEDTIYAAIQARLFKFNSPTSPLGIATVRASTMAGSIPANTSVHSITGRISLPACDGEAASPACKPSSEPPRLPENCVDAIKSEDS